MPERRPGQQIRIRQSATWHPMLDATEISIGHWRLSTGSTDPAYATVRLVRRGSEVRYRVDDANEEFVCYEERFSSACIRAFRECGGTV